MKPSLSTLLQRRDIWQASSHLRSSATISTGFNELDNALHEGGWGGQHLLLDRDSNLVKHQKRISLPSFTSNTEKLTLSNNNHLPNVSPVAIPPLALTQ